MIRTLHRWPGLLALALVMVLAISGAALSVFPAVERLSAPQAEAGLTVADLAGRIQAVYPGVEQIRRSPSGRITAFWFDSGTPGSAVIDPATGQAIANADPNPVERWLTNLHRSLFLGDAGRIAQAIGAAVILVLSVSGAILVARRMGGWRRWFAPLRGSWPGRIHTAIARVAVIGLALSSASALWMAASTFDLLPDGATTPAFPTVVSGQMGAAPATMAPLAAIPVAELRQLSFPYPGDATDAFTLKTDLGTGYIDQGTGELLAWAGLTGWERVSETIYMLHTGQGAASLGLVLGVMALGVPAMGVSGLVLWFAGRRARPRIRGNHPAKRAGTILLVGSEGGSTWGFAATLHRALSAVGQQVHVAPMSGFDPARHPQAERFIILAATWGEGQAPATAKGFIDRLAALKSIPEAPLAVLGFGDRSFPAFCAYADEVARLAAAKGWAQLMPFDAVDRQSPQDFARWGRALGAALGIELALEHLPVPPSAESLTLVSRRDYGTEVQAPTAILRFSLPQATLLQRLTGRGFARFRAGDLLGILPEESGLPRLYSLASGRRDGFVEIVVRKHTGGLCSAQLLALEPGQAIRAFVRPNPAFHPEPGKAPLILIGAGTGVGPLAGFIRGNGRKRPVHLFFGMRHPDSDFLYASEFTDWLADGRLAALTTAISRGSRPRYVQDALLAESAELARLIRDGAHVMVCGGRDMAAGVVEAFTDILAPVGLSPLALKAEARYAEDIY
ncbi:MAG: PepSY domain-containing protein [Mesorhizobium sp.]